MKLFLRYVFILLAVFFVSPLAGKNTLHYLKHRLINKEAKTVTNENGTDAEKTFFCEQDESPENNLDELEEDETLSKSLLSIADDLSFSISKNLCTPSHSFTRTGTGKLFLLFHSLKLYC